MRARCFLSLCFSLPLLLALPARAQEVEAVADPVIVQDVGEEVLPQPYISPEQQGFNAWLASYRAQALAAGIRAETLDANLTGLSFNARVVALDRAQPDDSRAGNRTTFTDYLSRRLDAARIAQGRRLASDLSATLTSVESRTGVPWAMLLGIWGMETAYGNHAGDFDLIRSLASLAYDGRRRELFTRELTAALKMIDRGMVTRAGLIGSWAGATGQPQFLPTSYLNYSADGDGDARADIWGSSADTLASIGNYLVRNGWRAGLGWGSRVYIPPTFDRARVRNLVKPSECPGVLSRHSRWIPVREWRALGIVPLGTTFPADDVLATLVEPDGPGNGGYLTYGNFRALLAYNCSNYYALSVALLGDALR